MSRPLRKFDIHRLDEVAWLHECSHDITGDQILVMTSKLSMSMYFFQSMRRVGFTGNAGLTSLNHLLSSFPEIDRTPELLRRGSSVMVIDVISGRDSLSPSVNIGRCSTRITAPPRSD